MKKKLLCLLLAMLMASAYTVPAGAEYHKNAEETSVSEHGIDLPETEESTEQSGVCQPATGWIQAEDQSWRLLDENGMMLTGWQQVDGAWYYLDENGIMLDGWQKIGEKWYLFGGGAMRTGWQKSGGKWYYLAESGAMQTGWLDSGGKRYYLTETGAMKTGSMTVGSTVYTMDASGAVVSSRNVSALPNKSYGWGQGVQVDALNRPAGALSYQDKFGGYDAYFIGANEKVIYLTFDEGYENGYTASILDTLKAKGVTAIFFITGDYFNKEPELIKRMIDEGHTVGNHTVNHPNLVNCSVSRRTDELGILHQQMQEKYGYTMSLLRPPEGVFSEQVLAQAQGMGYKTVFWSFAYKDWDPNNQMSAGTAYQKAVSALHPGAIYLLHAVSKTNAAILGDLIDEMRRQGYSFGTL